MDDDTLAQGIAQVAMGQWHHLASILRAGHEMSNPSEGYAINGAIATLTAPPGSPEWKIHHRDGWLFQVISWIAAVESGRGPTRAPHMSHAQKGFDGLQLLLSRDRSRVKRIVIFEDKATTNPRGQVRDKVWPALVVMEAGERDHELRSELSSLLEQAPNLDPVQAVNQVMMTKANRAYRISVTVGSTQGSRVGIARVFAGYDTVVPGPRFRRRAHVLEVEDLREWMSDLAEKAIEHLRAMN